MAKQTAGIPASAPPALNPDQNLLNEHEAAARLGLKGVTLQRWRWAGSGPVFRKIGNAVRYHPDDIAIYIEDARRTSTSDTGTGAAA